MKQIGCNCYIVLFHPTEVTFQKFQILCFWTLPVILFLFKTQCFGDWILKTDGIQPLKHCVLNKRIMDNVQKHNICVNVPMSLTFRSYSQELVLLITVILWVSANVKTKFTSEILSFRTLSIVLVLKNKLRETWRFGNWICFRPQVRGKKTYSVGSLRKS
jgi:hypothetical protein